MPETGSIWSDDVRHDGGWCRGSLFCINSLFAVLLLHHLYFVEDKKITGLLSSQPNGYEFGMLRTSQHEHDVWYNAQPKDQPAKSPAWAKSRQCCTFFPLDINYFCSYQGNGMQADKWMRDAFQCKAFITWILKQLNHFQHSWKIRVLP